MRARHANSSRPACLHVAAILALAFLAAASQVTVQDALTLSVVVIAHPPHFHYLPAVFENVAQQSAPPEELLICASGVTGLEALAAMVAAPVSELKNMHARTSSTQVAEHSQFMCSQWVSDLPRLHSLESVHDLSKWLVMQVGAVLSI